MKEKILVLNNIKPTECNFFFFIHKCYFMDLKIINIFRLVVLEFFLALPLCLWLHPSPLPYHLPIKKEGGGGGIIEGELKNKARFAFFLTKQHQLL